MRSHCPKKQFCQGGGKRTGSCEYPPSVTLSSGRLHDARIHIPTFPYGTLPSEVPSAIFLLPASGGPCVRVAHGSYWWEGSAEASSLLASAVVQGSLCSAEMLGPKLSQSIMHRAVAFPSHVPGAQPSLEWGSQHKGTDMALWLLVSHGALKGNSPDLRCCIVSWVKCLLKGKAKAHGCGLQGGLDAVCRSTHHSLRNIRYMELLRLVLGWQCVLTFANNISWSCRWLRYLVSRKGKRRLFLCLSFQYLYMERTLKAKGIHLHFWFITDVFLLDGKIKTP